VSGAAGVEKILGEAIGKTRADFEAERDAAQGEQVPLPIDLTDSDDHHSLPDAAEIVALQMELGCDVAHAVREHRRRGRGGRPKGARNKRTDDFARYMLEFGPHPGIHLMRRIARPVELLAAELGCTLLEAGQMQDKAAADLLPFFESKKPVALDVGGSAAITWNIVQAAGGGPVTDGGLIDGATGQRMLRLDGEETAENSHFASDQEGRSE
jgi:hypothetical protein